MAPRTAKRRVPGASKPPEFGSWLNANDLIKWLPDQPDQTRPVGGIQLDNEQAQWFAKVQRTYFELLSFGRTYPFGGWPGKGEPYGFASVGASGSLYTVVNPSQSVQRIPLPRVNQLQPALANGRIQFRDAGYKPQLERDTITLGPEQLALVGFGKYAHPKYNLGLQEDVIIPQSIRPLTVEFQPEGTHALVATVKLPVPGDLRFVMRQFADGHPVRTSRGAPPKGASLGTILRLEADQAGRAIPVQINYDKAIWSGLSWAVGEIKASDCQPGVPLHLRCRSAETKPVQLQAELYAVSYR